ncbi:MAG: fold metallo-hydrolase [Cyanobacteria bacterium RYN_339]|nr:fold metallo-hydrolase [Cyanobacteria bacterium RYN_339]
MSQHRYSLTFLGVGAGLSPELGNNNVLVENEDRSAHLLVDCGPVTAHELKLAGRLQDIRNVFITHVHDDHVGGLQLWAQLNRYVFQQTPALYFREELWEELWPATMRGGLERVSGPAGEPLTVGLDAYFEVHRLLEAQTVEIPGLPVLTPRLGLHVPGKPSFGFFLGEDVFFSADSQQLPPTVGPTGKPLRVIFQDCQLFDFPNGVHTSLARLNRELPPEQKAITRLMHYNYEPDMDARAMGFWGFVPRNEPVWV